MTDGVGPREERFVRLFALLLLAGAAIRLVGSVVAGFTEWHNATGPYFPGGRARAYDVLSTFGEGGDGAGVMLAIIATLLVWWLSTRGDPQAEWLRGLACWILGTTAVLAVLEAVGVGLVFSIYPDTQISRIVLSGAFALVALVIAIGAIVLTRQFGALVEERLAGDDIDAFVFALDRHSIDVRAFFSVRDAVRRTHLYTVEDEEFDFYTDGGEVLRASIVDDRIELQPTGEHRLPELVKRLQDFALRRGITVDDEDADDPTAYVDPINKWQWLEQWPPWMRPLGYLFRRR